MRKFVSINSIKFFTFILLISMFNSSCKKWIELPPPKDKIPADVVFADSASATTAIAAIYSSFGYFNNDGATSINGQYLSIFPALSSDELSTSATDVNTKQFVDNSLMKDNGTVAGMWSAGYAGIYKVNRCIKGISESKGISDQVKKRFIAEIKVARALYYFNFINIYGGVPLVTSTDYSVNATLPKASINEINQQIIADLTEARQGLQATYPSADRARPNLYTATALLAKVYLYQKNWTGAETMAKDVINSGLYNLVADPNNVFLGGSTEAIWQMPTIGSTSTQTQEAYSIVPTSATVIPLYFLTQSLLSAFESGDQRKIKWIMGNTVGSTTYYYPYKYKNIAPNATPREDYIIFRLAEQYLILAEALAQQNKLTEALPYLNQIRTRAGLATTNPSTQTDMLNAIMQERRIEFFCERANRWFDLKRTDAVNALIGALKPSTWQSEDALYPIPFSELLNNPFLTQNPGYN